MNYLQIEFALRGKTLPSDNGYAICSAIKKNVLKDSLPADVLLCSVPGIPTPNKLIYLNHLSKLRLRCPAEQVQQWYRVLQNQVLDIQGHLIRLIQPKILLPQPSETLKARMVTFKLESINHQELPFYFLKSCNNALEKLEIKAKASIDSDANGDLARRALKIRKKDVVGFAVAIEELNEQDSLKLQFYGIGGRKHFGCGWFYPTKKIL